MPCSRSRSVGPWRLTDVDLILSLLKAFRGIELLDLVGSGGVGSVYRGTQSSLGRVVAVKVLHEHLARHPELVARFEREARTAATIDHENVVRVIDLGTEGGDWFLVMPFVDGIDLRSLLARVPRPPAEATLSVMQDVLRGLAAAHALGIVHRDVKPGNVLIAKDGIARIADFSIAKALGSKGLTTEVGITLGTPAYMSPEQARGQESGPESDVFSAGTVLFEMLEGRHPFDAPTPAAMMLRIVSSLGAAPSADTPAALRAVLARAMHPDRARRYPDAASFLLGLERAAAECGIQPSRGIVAALVTGAPGAPVAAEPERRTVPVAPADAPPPAAATWSPTKLQAILAADFQEFTTWLQEDEAAAMAFLDRFHASTGTIVGGCGGSVFRREGDGTWARFDSVLGAVRAAAAMLRENAGAPRGLRIGIHLGDVRLEADGSATGVELAVAKRLESAAAPGTMLLSSEVRKELPAAPDGLTLEDAGEVDLKGIGRVHAWSGLLAGGAGSRRVRRGGSRPMRRAAGAAAALGLAVFALAAGLQLTPERQEIRGIRGEIAVGHETKALARAQAARARFGDPVFDELARDAASAYLRRQSRLDASKALDWALATGEANPSLRPVTDPAVVGFLFADHTPVQTAWDVVQKRTHDAHLTWLIADGVRASRARDAGPDAAMMYFELAYERGAPVDSWAWESCRGMLGRYAPSEDRGRTALAIAKRFRAESLDWAEQQVYSEDGLSLLNALLILRDASHPTAQVPRFRALLSFLDGQDMDENAKTLLAISDPFQARQVTDALRRYVDADLFDPNLEAKRALSKRLAARWR